MYITIILVALIAGATIAACKYLNCGTSLEAAQDAQLHSISVIVENLKDRYQKADIHIDRKYEFLPSEDMIRDAINEIYRISIMDCEK